MISRFISFEGIDGSGKSTQIKLLTDWLDKKNIEFIVVREPGSSKISENIRDILLDKKNTNLSSEAESFLFLSARSQLVHEIIKPALALNKYVICDRFIHSTVAYQGYGRGLNIDLLNSMNDLALNSISLKHTFLLDIDVKDALKRRIFIEEDRMEKSGKNFMHKVRLGYLELQKRNPNSITLLNAAHNENKIFIQIKSKLCSIFGELND